MKNMTVIRRGFIPVIILTLLFSIFSLTANGAEIDEASLPFTLSAPESTDLTWLEGEDSPTTMLCSYEMNDSMKEFFSQDENKQAEAFKKLGMKDVHVTAQIDWSYDSDSSWHYNKYWDGEGTDSGYDKNGNYRLGAWDEIRGVASPEGFSSTLVMRGFILSSDKNSADYLNRWWNGTDMFPGIKKQLKTGTCTFDKISKTESEMNIDYSIHTAYVRVRWDITYKGENDYDILSVSHIFSDWSDIAAYGKGIPEYEVFTTKNTPAPQLSALTVKNGDKPSASAALAIPEELKNRFIKLSVAGGSVSLKVKAKIMGTTSWKIFDCDCEIRNGIIEIPLDGLTDDSIIDDDSEVLLCCKYHIVQNSFPDGDYIGETDSHYSEILKASVSGKAENVGFADEKAEEDTDSETSTCHVCGICPMQPLGICLFIWGAVIFSVIIIIICAVIKEKISRKKP